MPTFKVLLFPRLTPGVCALSQGTLLKLEAHVSDLYLIVGVIVIPYFTFSFFQQSSHPFPSPSHLFPHLLSVSPQNTYTSPSPPYISPPPLPSQPDLSSSLKTIVFFKLFSLNSCQSLSKSTLFFFPPHQNTSF